MTNTNRYLVIEDNGGGLSLYIQGKMNAGIIYSHSGYEYNPGQLSTDLDALDNGVDPSVWEGCDNDPQGNYNQLTKHTSGWKIVADGNGAGKRSLHKHLMGRAAQIEFVISDEDRDRSLAASLMGKSHSSNKVSSSRENGRKGGRPRKIN